MNTHSPGAPAAKSPLTIAFSSLFFPLACSITWLLALPLALAWMRREAPSPLAVAAAGLSAFGPSLAALMVAWPQGELGPVFGNFRCRPVWVVLALLTPGLVHTLARVLYVLFGGALSSWLAPPLTAEQWAAFLVFPLGEEFGWRGYAQPRMAARHGRVRGTLLVGGVWGLWHLVYSVTPGAAGFDPVLFAFTLAELPCYALVLAWLAGRGGYGMPLAIAFHAGAHLDHLEFASDRGLQAVHVVAVAALALFAARSLSRSDAAERSALYGADRLR